MTRIIRLPLVFLMAVLLSCSNSHLIVDRSYRNRVETDFRARAAVYSASVPGLFRLTDTIKDNARREAVQFLLAYMPLSDLAVYDPGFLLANVNAALKAREEAAWGASVPYEVFLHFVLPLRVNNENPDSFRISYYDELMQRIEGFDATAAALEINRWCQEKVAYQPSDSRTSSPMATILSARGRCGEESTFTVSALRTAGIPARQVYTPRWAHSDDNHAWVEFWSDGQWHYMGACEPEPVPDRGWFTEPARRAMLIHTRAFGRYNGTEPLVRRDSLYSEINVLDRYAPVKKLHVTVTDSTGTSVPEASVGYLLYNYAEFYPLARLKCNASGESEFTTGMGSLLIWADDGTRYGFAFASPSDTAMQVMITALHMPETEEPDLEAPPVLPPLPGIDAALAAENNLKNKHGDSIRQAYINSWMKDVPLQDLAMKTGLPEEKIEKVLQQSMGNYRSIAAFIAGSGEKAVTAMKILENISEKDLRDTPAEVLIDHYDNAPVNASGADEKIYEAYVLSPRIDNELLTAFRSSLKQLVADISGTFAAVPEAVASWADTAIKITDTENYYGTPVVPAGVEKLRMADRHSRDIFFVALCRTAGFPARLAPDTGRPQYYSGGEWYNVWFSGDTEQTGERAYVTFTSSETNPVPEYHVHFSLSLLEKGRYMTLDFGYGVKISDLPGNIPVFPGKYMLTTGNRQEDGNVLAGVSFFVINPGERINLDIMLRHETKDISLEGRKTDLQKVLVSYDGRKTDLQKLSGKGLVFIWIEPGKEPTRHILNDLPQLKNDFDKWGGWFIFLTDPARTDGSFRPGDIAGLPANSVFVADSSLTLLGSVVPGNPSDHPMPVVICCDREGNILFSSEGYRIGTGEQILKNIR
jgi:hypothetical protein